MKAIGSQLPQQTFKLTDTTIVMPLNEIVSSDMLDHLSQILARPIGVDSTIRETLSLFGALTESCWRLSRGNELKMAESILWAVLPKLATIAQQPSMHQQMAAGISAQGYLLAASLTGHSNNLSARQHLSEQALHYGNLAKDRHMQLAALRQLAATFDYQERPDKVLRTYQLALPYLNEVSPLLRSRICAATSGIYAQTKQRQEAHHFLGLAYEHFPEKPEEDPSFLYADCGYFTLVYWNGLNHLRLDRPKEAAKAFAVADGLRPKIQIPERIRIEFLNHQAATFIELRDLEQCCTYLEAAVKASFELGSERRFSESFRVFKRMPPTWYNEPSVKMLRDLFMR